MFYFINETPEFVEQGDLLVAINNNEYVGARLYNGKMTDIAVMGYDGTQLTQAVYYAGGPIDIRANIKNVELVRTNSNGSITFKKYNTKLNKVNSKSENPMLEDGDIVRVSSTALAKTSDIIKATTSPALNIFALYKFFD